MSWKRSTVKRPQLHHEIQIGLLSWQYGSPVARASEPPSRTLPQAGRAARCQRPSLVQHVEDRQIRNGRASRIRNHLVGIADQGHRREGHDGSPPQTNSLLTIGRGEPYRQARRIAFLPGHDAGQSHTFHLAAKQLLHSVGGPPCRIAENFHRYRPAYGWNYGHQIVTMKAITHGSTSFHPERVALRSGLVLLFWSSPAGQNSFAPPDRRRQPPTASGSATPSTRASSLVRLRTAALLGAAHRCAL